MSLKIVLLLSILATLAVTENGLDPIWDSLDIYFRQNYPNQEVKDCLSGSQLIQVVPEPEKIQFFYQHTDERQTVISFRLQDDGTVGNVLGLIEFPDGSVKEYLGEDISEESEEDLFVVLENFLQESFGPHITFDNLADIQSQLQEDGECYTINFNCGDDFGGLSGIKYEVKVVQQVDGFLIKDYRYNGIPDFDESLLQSLDDQREDNLEILNDISRVLVESYSELENAFVLGAKSYGPYYEVLFQTNVQGVKEKRSITILYDIYSSNFQEIGNSVLNEQTLNNPVLRQATQILAEVENRRIDLQDTPKRHQVVNQQGKILFEQKDKGAEDSGLLEIVIVNEEQKVEIGSSITNSQGITLEEIRIEEEEGQRVQIIVQRAEESSNEIGIVIRNNEITQIEVSDEKEIEIELENKQKAFQIVKEIKTVVKEKIEENKEIFIEKNVVINQNSQIIDEDEITVELGGDGSEVIYENQNVVSGSGEGNLIINQDAGQGLFVPDNQVLQLPSFEEEETEEDSIIVVPGSETTNIQVLDTPTLLPSDLEEDSIVIEQETEVPSVQNLPEPVTVFNEADTVTTLQEPQEEDTQEVGTPQFVSEPIFQQITEQVTEPETFIQPETETTKDCTFNSCGRYSEDHCLKYNGKDCVKCANRYYLNINNRCEKVQDECQSYNHETGECYSCYYGFFLSGRVCYPIHPFCLEVNEKGKCIKCPKGYLLDGGQCYKIKQGCTDYHVDPFCAAWDEGYNCLECQKGCYFNREHQCKLQDPHCCQFDYKNIVCQKCHRGFIPEGQKCIRSF